MSKYTVTVYRRIEVATPYKDRYADETTLTNFVTTLQMNSYSALATVIDDADIDMDQIVNVVIFHNTPPID